MATESGRYAMTGVFGPDPAFTEAGSRFHGYPFSVPSDIGFYRHGPQNIVVASPYTGLYAGRLPGTGPNRQNCASAGFVEPTWKDLSPFMPSGSAYVSSVSYIGGSAVVFTAGRGVYAIANIRAALPATYFSTASQVQSSGAIASPRHANGTPLPWGRVHMKVMEAASRNIVVNKVIVRTGTSGEVLVPTMLQPGDYIADLQFLGDGSSEPSRTKFRLRIIP